MGAARTARSTSIAEASVTWSTTSSVAGFSTSVMPPPELSRHRPSIHKRQTIPGAPSWGALPESAKVPAAAAARLPTYAAPVLAAAAMARYMKPDMPCYGVKTPERRPIAAELARRWVPATHGEYEALVIGLWRQPHREEKYLAIGLAERHKRFITVEAGSLYRRLIVE